MKLHNIALCKTGLMNSIVADARSKTNSVKVVQKRSLCQIILMREKIMQDRYVTYREVETYLGISPTNIHLTLHKQLSVRNVCSRYMAQSLKKGSCRLVHKNVGKIRWWCFKRRLLDRHSWQIMDLLVCIWARKKTTVHHVNLRREAKCNERCLRISYYQLLSPESKKFFLFIL